MADRNEPQLLTSGRMAEALGVPIHRVLHVLATRPEIRPRARAGTLRLYGLDALEAVRTELALKTQLRRERGAK